MEAISISTALFLIRLVSPFLSKVADTTATCVIEEQFYQLRSGLLERFKKDPVNHDLKKAVNQAFFKALRSILEEYHRELTQGSLMGNKLELQYVNQRLDELPQASLAVE